MAEKLREALRREEWDFSRLLPDELTIGVWWEYLREIPEAISAIAMQRRISRRQSVANARKRTSKTTQQKDRGVSGAEIKAMGIFYKLPFNFAGDGEWPSVPFLAVPRTRRAEIVKLRENPDRPEPLHEITLGEIRETLTPHPEYTLSDWIERRIFTERGVLSTEIAAFAINWTMSNEALAQAFTSWLVERRPKQIAPEESRGAGSKERQIRSALKGLGALRLLRAMPWQKAYEHTAEILNKPLFSEIEHAWKRPASTAKTKIEVIRSRLNFRDSLLGDEFRLMQELCGSSSKKSD